jgi:predicted ester cyclase
MTTQTSESQQQSAERIEAAFLEAYNIGNLDVLDDIAAPDFVAYHFSVPEPIRGIEAYKKRIIDIRAGFPDFEMESEGLIVEGERSAAMYRWMGTHDGEYNGLAPTGTKVEVTAATVSEMRDGELVEFHIFGDRMDLLEQLGMMPDS